MSNAAEAVRQASDLYEVMPTIRKFIGPSQLAVMVEGAQGEEREFFINTMLELAELIDKMPSTYQTQDEGSDSIAYLHYFKNDMDFYITEKDMEDDQIQAFGLAKIWEAEFGYISIVELLENGMELDIHWTPKAVRKCI